MSPRLIVIRNGMRWCVHALACAGQPEWRGTRVLGSSLAVSGVSLRLLVAGRSELWRPEARSAMPRCLVLRHCGVCSVCHSGILVTWMSISCSNGSWQGVGGDPQQSWHKPMSLPRSRASQMSLGAPFGGRIPLTLGSASMFPTRQQATVRRSQRRR